MSETKERVIITPTGFELRIIDDGDGNLTYEMTDVARQRKLEFVAGVFYDRQNRVCYRANDGELCRVAATAKTPAHVWEFEDARLNVDYRSASGERIKHNELLDPTGFLTKSSCAFLASWLETHYPALDYFIAPSQFSQGGTFTRYPQNQLYVLIVNKEGGETRVKRENAGLLVSNSFQRYDSPVFIKQFFDYVLSADGWDTNINTFDVTAMRGPAAAAFNKPAVPVAPAPVQPEQEQEQEQEQGSIVAQPAKQPKEEEVNG